MSRSSLGSLRAQMTFPAAVIRAGVYSDLVHGIPQESHHTCGCVNDIATLLRRRFCRKLPVFGRTFGKDDHERWTEVAVHPFSNISVRRCSVWSSGSA